MVEGPGATWNGKKVRVAVGKRVCVPNDALPTLPHHLVGELSNLTLSEAFSIGKELFLIFADETTSADVALRLHFGMNGSLMARKVKSGSDLQKSVGPPWKQNQNPSLRLYFIDNGGASSTNYYVIVETRETTVTYPVSASNARNKYMEHTQRDVCSELFNAQDVFTEIRRAGNNMIISDALLNQDIFPGVGNIIKIESLHRSKVDPRRRVNSLTDPELRRIIRHTRKFSMDWLKSGRAGTKLVYNQTTCGTCQGMKVKMQKIGGKSPNSDGIQHSSVKGHAFMSRVTFWCTVCQPCQPLNASSVGENGGSSMLMRTVNSGNACGNANPQMNTTTSRPQMQCPQHGTKSLKLCRVRKGNQNTLRIFFTCKFKGCQYFAWADNQFSNCKCGKKAVLRVSKTERSGGKWFLCCASGDKSNNKSNACGHFEWANETHLAPIRSLLTPLL